MMLFKWKRILLATLAATSLTWCGGVVHAADASGNTKTVTSETASADITGGNTASGNADNNTLTVTDSDMKNNQVLGGSTGSSTGTASNNTVTLRNVKNISFVDGGIAISSSGNSNHNTVYIWDSELLNVHGGHTGTGSANYNKVYFYSGTVSYVTGAGIVTTNGEANFNELYIYGGTLNGLVQGGYTYPDASGKTNYNLVEVHGGTINGQIMGGYVGVEGQANNNTVNIYGGTINGEVLGGHVGSGEVSGNTINIYGGDLSNAKLRAGDIGGSDPPAGSGNSINFYTSGITAQNISGFQNINFYLPSNYQKDTVLTLIGGDQTNLGDLSTVGFAFSPNSNIRRGDVLNLIHNTGNTISINDDIGTENLSTKMSRGVSFDYDLDLQMSSDGHTLTGVIGSHDGLKTEDVKQIPISNPVPVFMVSDHPIINALHDMGGPDFDEGDRAEKPEDVRETHGFEIFAHSGYGHLKTKTGKGSYVRTDSGNYDLGFARSLEMKNGTFVWAPIIEHSAGHYDAVLSDGRKGYGSAKYAAGGLIFRQINDKGYYFEGSARFGRSENDFISDHFKNAQGNFVRATYHTSSPIFAGHVRIGKAMRLNKNNLLDVYGIYAYARQGGMNTELSTGDPYEFSSVTSSRARVGYRLTTRTSKISRIYTGLAYQYESNSDSEAKTWDAEGMSWNVNAGSKGSSGMLELGWQIKPTKDNPWLVDINATGWVGHQKGATAMAKIQKSF